MVSENYREVVKPILRPHQVSKLEDEAHELTGMLSAPPHIAGAIENRGELRRHLNSIQQDLDTQAPKVYEAAVLDSALKRSSELHDELVVGMPTQAEMRRNPAGATDKHRGWEHRNKSKILEWKTIQLRLHKSEALGSVFDARDVANFEKYRPVGGSQELGMHNEQIPGKDYHLPPAGAAPAVVFSDDRVEALKMIDPKLAGRLAVMSNDQRSKVLEFMNAYLAQDAVESPEVLLTYKEAARRKASSERLKERHRLDRESKVSTKE